MKYTKTIRASKTARPARSVRASRAALRRSVKADEEIVDDIPAEVEDVEIPAEEAEVTVDESATELLFEAEDVAELVAEVTGEAVDVTVDDTEVIFTIGDDEYTVTPEGDEEVVEQSTKIFRSRAVEASKKAMPARKVAARRPQK
jgi:uncharacterized protein YlxW (UPF0749 family)